MSPALRAARPLAVLAIAALVGVLALSSIARAGEYQAQTAFGAPTRATLDQARDKAILAFTVFVVSVGFVVAFYVEPVPDGDGDGSDGVPGVTQRFGRPDQPLPVGDLVDEPAERAPVAEGLGGFGGGGPADGGGAPLVNGAPEGDAPLAVGGKPAVVAPLPLGGGVEPGIGNPADGAGGAPQAGAPFGSPDPRGGGPEAKPGKAPDGTLIPQFQHGAADGDDGRAKDAAPVEPNPAIAITARAPSAAR